MSFLWDQLVNWVLGKMVTLFSYVSDNFFAFFGMNLDNFFTYIPIKTFYDVMQGIGLGLCIILAMATIFGNLFVIITDSHEDSLKVAGRMCLSVILIFFASDIFFVIHYIFSLPFSFIKTSNFGNASSTIPWKELANKITENPWYEDIAAAILTIVLLIILFKDFFKLLLSAAERYVAICVGQISAPLVFSTVATKNTSSITLSFVRLLISQYILMMFDLIFVNGAIIAMRGYCGIRDAGTAAGLSQLNQTSEFANSLQGDTLSGYQNGAISPIIFIILVCAFLRMGQKLDQYMHNLGFNVRTMGSALGNELLSTGLGAAFLVGNVARGLVKGGARLGGRAVGFGGRGGRGGDANVFSPNDPNSPLFKGPGGGGASVRPGSIADTLMGGYARWRNGRASNNALADTFANNLKHGRNQTALNQATGELFGRANNAQIAKLGEQFKGGAGNITANRDGTGTFTDANGRKATILGKNPTQSQIDKFGAKPITDSDGKTLFYVGQADVGFGTQGIEAGQRGNLSNIMSNDVASSLGFSGGVSGFEAEALGDNRYSVFKAGSNDALGTVTMGNDENALLSQAGTFDGVATNGYNTFALDNKVQDASGVHMSIDSIQDGAIKYGDNYIDSTDIARYGAEHSESIGNNNKMVSYDVNKAGDVSAIFDTGENLAIPASEIGENGSVPLLEDNKELNYYQGYESILGSHENVYNFIQETNTVPTEMTGFDDHWEVSGIDKDNNLTRDLELNDISQSTDRSSIVNTKYGRYSVN